MWRLELTGRLRTRVEARVRTDTLSSHKLYKSPTSISRQSSYWSPSPTSLQRLGEAHGCRQSRPLAARWPCQRPSPAPGREHRRLQVHQPLVAARTHQPLRSSSAQPQAAMIPARAHAHGAAHVSWMRLQGRGRQLGSRPHDSAASAARSRLLDLYLLRGASLVLSDPCTPVNARHIHVMCATKDARRARARAAWVEAWVSCGRKSRRGERTAFAMSSLKSTETSDCDFQLARAGASARR